MMPQISIRVEPIDNHHPAWSEVLAAIFRNGNREGILLREDGWLSSRQAVLAAFDGPRVVGHLCFRVEPSRSAAGQAVLHSRIDSFSIDDSHSDSTVEQLLMERAESQAQVMRCKSPRQELVAC